MRALPAPPEDISDQKKQGISVCGFFWFQISRGEPQGGEGQRPSYSAAARAIGLLGWVVQLA
jgi:hypothetical protein